MKATNPQIEIEAAAIARLLMELPIDGVLSYADASAQIGRDVTNGARFSLMKARRIAEKECGSLFATVRQVGVKRLPASHVAGVGADVRKRVGRAANRGYERLTAIRYNDLDGSSRTRVDAERSLLGAISSLATSPTVKKIEAYTTTGPVPVGKVLEALK